MLIDLFDKDARKPRGHRTERPVTRRRRSRATARRPTGLMGLTQQGGFSRPGAGVRARSLPGIGNLLGAQAPAAAPKASRIVVPASAPCSVKLPGGIGKCSAAATISNNNSSSSNRARHCPASAMCSAQREKQQQQEQQQQSEPGAVGLVLRYRELPRQRSQQRRPKQHQPKQRG
jgi:hypothetical protein